MQNYEQDTFYNVGGDAKLLKMFRLFIHIVWKHIQYFTTYQVMIVTQFPYVVKFTIRKKGNGYVIMYKQINYLVFNA